jgi:hypothetical protein
VLYANLDIRDKVIELPIILRRTNSFHLIKKEDENVPYYDSNVFISLCIVEMYTLSGHTRMVRRIACHLQ